MGDIVNGNINLDKLTAVEKLLNALTEGEDSAEEKGSPMYPSLPTLSC